MLVPVNRGKGEVIRKVLISFIRPSLPSRSLKGVLQEGKLIFFASRVKSSAVEHCLLLGQVEELFLCAWTRAKYFTHLASFILYSYSSGSQARVTSAS